MIILKSITFYHIRGIIIERVYLKNIFLPSNPSLQSLLNKVYS